MYVLTVVAWCRKARCCVLHLHCLHWRLETVVLRPAGEAHLYGEFQSASSRGLHDPDILVAFGLSDCAYHPILRTRDAGNTGKRDATSYLALPAFFTSNRST